MLKKRPKMPQMREVGDQTLTDHKELQSIITKWLARHKAKTKLLIEFDIMEIISTTSARVVHQSGYSTTEIVNMELHMTGGTVQDRLPHHISV